MKNQIEEFLKQERRSFSKKSTRKDLNKPISGKTILPEGCDAELLLNEIHIILLTMFNDYSIFREPIDLSDNSIVVCQNVEAKIVGKKYRDGSSETMIRSGLIQVYLYHFAYRYLDRPSYTYKFIQSNHIYKKNKNSLQKDRERVFSEIQARLIDKNQNYQFHFHQEDQVINRTHVVYELLSKLDQYNNLLIIGPYGIGKSVLLGNIRNSLQESWDFFYHQFSVDDQVDYPDFFTKKVRDKYTSSSFSQLKHENLLLQFDDAHLLPTSLLQELRQKTINEVKDIGRKKYKKINIIISSAYELDEFIEIRDGSPSFRLYHIPEFNKREVELLVNKCGRETIYSVENIFSVTRGYPSLVKQMLTNDIAIDGSRWFSIVFTVINQDKSIIQLMKAVCTFRYISPFFLSDLYKHIGDGSLMRDVWKVNHDFSKPLDSRLIWKQLVDKNSFITRILIEKKDLNFDKNYMVSRVLRQLAENDVKITEPGLFETRHRLASEYYYSLCIRDDISLKKKVFTLIEYIYHISKLNLPEIQMFNLWKKAVLAIETGFLEDEIRLFRNALHENLQTDEEIVDNLTVKLLNRLLDDCHPDLKGKDNE